MRKIVDRIAKIAGISEECAQRVWDICCKQWDCEQKVKEVVSVNSKEFLIPFIPPQTRVVSNIPTLLNKISVFETHPVKLETLWIVDCGVVFLSFLPANQILYVFSSSSSSSSS